MKIKLGLISAALIFSCTATYADLADCTQANSSAKQAINLYSHCAYLTGLNSTDLNDGRYLKIEAVSGQQYQSMTVCANNALTLTLTPDDLPSLDKPKFSFSICQDAAYQNCQLVAIDQVNIIKNGEDYLAEPELFKVDLSALKNQFPSCKPGPDTQKIGRPFFSGNR